ncbi:RHS repeat domain-containing protein [Rummeliibacillus sp. BSL5]
MFVWDEASYVVKEVTEPSEQESEIPTSYTLDENYNILSVTNPDGSTVNNEYNKENGNLLSSSSSEGTETYEYNAQNKVEKIIATNGEITNNNYEGPYLKSSTVNDETTHYDYDEFGRMTKTTYPNGTYSQTAFEDNERKVTMIEGKMDDNKTTSITYTVYGQKQAETDAVGNTTSYTYDPLYPDTITSITSIVDGKENTTTYEYDANNNLHILTDALGRNKVYEYDKNDQLTMVEMPTMTFKYHYDTNGELDESILPSGLKTLYSYTDGLVDTIQIKSSDEILTSTAYKYDDNGNTSKIMLDDKEIKSFSYTPANLLEKYTLGSFTRIYKYEDEKHPERETQRQTSYNNVSITEDTTFKEDSEDIDHVKYRVGEKTIHDYQFDHNTTENQATTTLNNDLLKQEVKFNSVNLLTSLTYTTKAQQPFEITYDYTNNGNISKENIQGDTVTYEYDGNNQLKAEIFDNGHVNSYKYDEVGNRKEATVNGQTNTFEYNDANQIKTKNSVSYQYDMDGNLTQDENYVYTYNPAQQLTKVQTLTGKVVATYSYDENGLRLTKTVGDTTHEYFYNNEVLNMEVVNTNGKTQYRYYEWNGYTPLGMIVKEDGEEKAYQFITNHRGDVLSIHDEQDQEVGSYQYDAYGNVLSIKGDIAKENPLRYAGYYFDVETKNYYLQARYYNPANGAFVALDPHPGDEDEPLSQNGYTYANNNPVANIDYNGAWSLPTRVIKTVIDLAVTAIPALWGINRLMSLRKMTPVYRLWNGNKIRVTTTVTNTFTRLGLSWTLARAISGMIANSILTIFDTSVGGIAVKVLKKYFFKTYKKKQKKYLYWGPITKVEYINFSKRK